EFDGYSPIVATTIPAAPTSVAAINDAPDDVTLSWVGDPENPATSFTIEREGPADTSYVTIGQVAGSIATYDDPTVQPNTTYSYVVTATDSFGTSEPSAPIQVA